jgi:hypothetical protein
LIANYLSVLWDEYVYFFYKNEKAEVFQRLVGINKGIFSIFKEKYIVEKAKYVSKKKLCL